MENIADNIRFRESQTFPAWVYLLAGGVMALGVSMNVATAMTAPHLRPSMLIGGLVGTLGLGLALNLLYVRTVVTDRAVEVRFGRFVALYRRVIPVSEIASAEAVTYSPIRDYGGWGIRGFGDNMALNAKGDRGVLVALRDGRRIMIGSQRAEELAAALRWHGPG